ncbi:MAG: universal stress protein [Desulfobacterales bacterium]|nr:MAG: universal stress protein [Desulfobacterales bacterium]
MKRILYATDLSENSFETLRSALNSACQRGAALVVLHVISQRSITIAKTAGYFFNEGQESRIIKAKAKAALERMKKQFETFRQNELKAHPEYATGIEAFIVQHGKIAEEIVKNADRLGCEMIVMGSHGKVIFRKIFPGSTSQKVLRRSKKPVAIIPSSPNALKITTHDA